MPAAKEQIRQIISENNLSGVADVYALLRDSFKDVPQELMEAELDATLGYEKRHKGDLKTENERDGRSLKTLKSQYGEFQIDVPRDRNGSVKPSLPSRPDSIGMDRIARKPQSFSRGRAWAEPIERAIRCDACLPCKKMGNRHKLVSIGYPINRKM